jgi:P27 family predicted phage terminase small subunit
MPGPPPKPTFLKILQGNPGKQRLNKNEPKAAVIEIIPAPPKHLRKVAKEKWRMLAPELIHARLLTKLDMDCFALLCEEFAEYESANEFIAERGAFFPMKNEKGEVYDLRQYPAVAQRQAALVNITRLGDRLGLSPAARSRITIPDRRDSEKSEAARRLLGG